MSTNPNALPGHDGRTRGATVRPLTPPVDISENGEGITLTADLPGVSKETLNVHVEGRNLLIEGTAELAIPENAQTLHADVRGASYRRRFLVSSELETGKIEASLKDGVLTVRIPKRAELRPRRIEVQTH
jgi:HSP20 family molecular chaperone IbpA